MENPAVEDVFPKTKGGFPLQFLSLLEGTWRIIPFSKWLTTMVSKVSSLSRVLLLANGLNGLQMGATNHLLTGMILAVSIHVCSFGHE